MTYPSNKKLGTSFEREFCKLLADNGFWVHFCTPSANGSQPCDIIAVKDEKAYLIDCKTCADKKIRLSRLEDNQVNAFEKWIKCGNSRYSAIVAVKHKDKVYCVPYAYLAVLRGVVLTDEFLFEKLFSN